MVPPFDPDGDLPVGVHQATRLEFSERFCIFARSDKRLILCRRIEQMVEETSASAIADRIIFGGSFVTSKAEPNDFDCIVVLKADTLYEELLPFQRWVADSREASRRYRGDVFVAKAAQPTLTLYFDFFICKSAREACKSRRGSAMIQNHDQLRITQEQIQRLEHALEQLRKTATKAEFTAQSPTVIEHIRRMRAEIDEYLGMIKVEYKE